MIAAKSGLRPWSLNLALDVQCYGRQVCCEGKGLAELKRRARSASLLMQEQNNGLSTLVRAQGLLPPN